MLRNSQKQIREWTFSPTSWTVLRMSKPQNFDFNDKFKDIWKINIPFSGIGKLRQKHKRNAQWNIFKWDSFPFPSGNRITEKTDMDKIQNSCLNGQAIRKKESEETETKGWDGELTSAHGDNDVEAGTPQTGRWRRRRRRRRREKVRRETLNAERQTAEENGFTPKRPKNMRNKRNREEAQKESTQTFERA